MQRFIFGISLILAPFGEIAAGIVLAAQGSSQGWILAHFFMLGSIFMYVAAILGVRQLLGPSKAPWGALGDGSTILALLGLLLTVSQITIDLTVGFLASTPAEMDHMFGRIRAIPAMEITFYSIGPSLFFLGLLLLILILARFHVILLWGAGLASAGIILGVVGKEINVFPAPALALFTLGSVWICFLPTAWKLLASR